ncbi:MAG: 1-acyl-sn-glycerol-3-phosphate acyltransferase [Treponema sp.]|nr:1-acyl-sn-glycerol-3-phosphate acyltransferase [Treponema sp.]
MPVTLRDKYQQFFAELTKASTASAKIDENCIYQEANRGTRKYMDYLLKDNIIPDSHLGNMEKFRAFYDKIVNEGKSGVIMMEHFSNMDLPAFLFLLENCGEEWAKDFASRVVAIAGMKLNEASAGVRAFSESFTRVVIYPTRSLDALKGKNIDPAVIEEEEKRARKINFAAMREMDNCKKRGQIILVFPSGTRYRPGKPETKRGLRELDSYLRIFDIMLPVSINGCCLKFNPEAPEDMLSDIVEPETIIMTASDYVECKPFRKAILESLPEDCPDPKQATVDAVMAIMEKKHDEVEAAKTAK